MASGFPCVESIRSRRLGRTAVRTDNSAEGDAVSAVVAGDEFSLDRTYVVAICPSLERATESHLHSRDLDTQVCVDGVRRIRAGVARKAPLRGGRDPTIDFLIIIGIGLNDGSSLASRSAGVVEQPASNSAAQIAAIPQIRIDEIPRPEATIRQGNQGRQLLLTMPRRAQQWLTCP